LRNANPADYELFYITAPVVKSLPTFVTSHPASVASPLHLENALKVLPSVAAKFRTGTITHTFQESIPQVVSSSGDVLKLATLRSDEAFKKSDSMTIGWGKISLGKTVSSIGVPVTFRYHLRLSDPWRLAAKDHVCVVLPPPRRPSLPPAIHTDKMEKDTTNGWARNKDENLAELENFPDRLRLNVL